MIHSLPLRFTSHKLLFSNKFLLLTIEQVHIILQTLNKTKTNNINADEYEHYNYEKMNSNGIIILSSTQRYHHRNTKDKYIIQIVCAGKLQEKSP